MKLFPISWTRKLAHCIVTLIIYVYWPWLNSIINMHNLIWKGSLPQDVTITIWIETNLHCISLNYVHRWSHSFICFGYYHLPAQELRRAMTQVFGQKIGKDDLRGLMLEIDSNGDGMISFEGRSTSCCMIYKLWHGDNMHNVPERQ